MPKVAHTHGTPASAQKPTAYGHALAHDQRRARKPFTDRKLTRSRDQRLIGGVCGGFATFIGTSARNVRLVYALSVVLSVGTTAVGYLLLWLLLPAEPATAN